MLHFLISFILAFSISIFCVAAEKAAPIELVKPLNQLFSHKVHLGTFGKLSVSCKDCHSFSVKPIDPSPLGPGVEKGFLTPNRKTCHECHMQSIPVPRPNQCLLCHKDTRQIMPVSHKQNWRVRHGAFAEADRDSCKECHTDRSCTQCHTQRDTLKPMVHRPNFRVTHSIEARGNPESCVVCHSTTTGCMQCHSKGFQ